MQDLSLGFSAVHMALQARRGPEAAQPLLDIMGELASRGAQRALWLAEAAAAIQMVRHPSWRTTLIPRLRAACAPLGPAADGSPESRAHADDLRPAAERACAALGLTYLLVMEVKPDDALETGTLAWDLCDLGAHPLLRWKVGIAMAALFVSVGDLDGAREVIRITLAKVPDVGRRGVTLHFHHLLVLAVSEEWTAAVEIISSHPWLSDVETFVAMPGLPELIALVWVNTGRGDEADAMLDHPLPAWADESHLLCATRAWACATVHLARGRPIRAKEVLLHYLTKVDSGEHLLAPLNGTQIYRRLSEANEALGDWPEALGNIKRSQSFCISWIGQSVHTRLKVLHSADRRSGDAVKAQRMQMLERAVQVAQTELAEGRDAMSRQQRYFAHLVHELRNPAASVAGMTSLLMMTSLDERGQRYVGLMRGAAEMLQALCTDLLDIAKLEAGQFQLNLAGHDLGAALAESTDLWRATARLNGVNIELHLDPDLPSRLWCDRLRIQQILMNLLRNAVKFTRQGEIIVTIRWVSSDDGHCGELRGEVRDTGIGIAKDAIGKLFKEFTQANSSIAEQFGGTGLGLALCRNLVDLMGGSIGVDSELDVGSRFWFTLPLQAHGEVCTS